MFQLAQKHAVLIAGPTASGKSSLALQMAEEAKEQGRMAVVFNADSMQVYRELSLITARPTPSEQCGFAHKLFGFIPAARRYNVGCWIDDIQTELSALTDNTLAIIVGGTGLYFKALTQGVAGMPDVPDAVRLRLCAYLEQEGREALHQRLAACDPQMAASLSVADAQRVLRALEIFEVSGRSMRAYHSHAHRRSILDGVPCLKLIIWPRRSHLYKKIDQRFDQIVASGGVAEVARLNEQMLAPNLPAMKAIGVPQITDYLENRLSLDEAVARAKQESRRYAKRQMTFLRNQMDNTWHRLE